MTAPGYDPRFPSMPLPSLLGATANVRRSPSIWLSHGPKQVFFIPNHVLKSKTIVNIQRSAHQWHEFYIHVSSGERDKMPPLSPAWRTCQGRVPGRC